MDVRDGTHTQDDVFVMKMMIGVCVFVGGEEQSESLLEEVLCSLADVLQQRPRETAKGSINQNPLFRTTNQNPPQVVTTKSNLQH